MGQEMKVRIKLMNDEQFRDALLRWASSEDRNNRFADLIWVLFWVSLATLVVLMIARA
jgi:hypothetical protein